jgi:hypothetical protein
MMKTYIFKISSLYSSPKIAPSGPEISRQIEVPENTSLYKLAEAIVDSYNFNFDHCFGFFSEIVEWGYLKSERKYELFTDLIEEGEDLEPTGAGSVKKTKVKDVWQNIGDKMLSFSIMEITGNFLWNWLDLARKKPIKSIQEFCEKSEERRANIKVAQNRSLFYLPQ